MKKVVKGSVIYCLFCLLTGMAHAHYLAQTVMWGKNSGIQFKTALTFDDLDGWTFSEAVYYENPLTIVGGEASVDFRHWLGWHGFFEFVHIGSEMTYSVATGNPYLFFWDEGALGFDLSVAYSDIQKLLGLKGVAMGQLQPGAMVMLEAGKWMLTLDGSAYLYNFDINSKTVERYQPDFVFYWQFLEFRQDVYSDFVLYQAGLTIGRDWGALGFTNIKIDYAKTWTKGSIMVLMARWMFPINETYDMSLTWQYTTRRNMVLHLDVAYRF